MILGFFDNALYVWTHTHVRMVSITYCISYPVVRKSQYFQAQSKTTWVETIGQIAWCRPDTLLILHGQYIYMLIFTNYIEFFIELVMFCIWHLFPAFPQYLKKLGRLRVIDIWLPVSIVADWSARKQQRSERGVGGLCLDGEKPRLSVDLVVDVSWHHVAHVGSFGCKINLKILRLIGTSICNRSDVLTRKQTFHHKISENHELSPQKTPLIFFPTFL